MCISKVEGLAVVRDGTCFHLIELIKFVSDCLYLAVIQQAVQGFPLCCTFGLLVGSEVYVRADSVKGFRVEMVVTFFHLIELFWLRPAVAGFGY